MARILNTNVRQRTVTAEKSCFTLGVRSSIQSWLNWSNLAVVTLLLLTASLVANIVLEGQS